MIKIDNQKDLETKLDKPSLVYIREIMLKDAKTFSLQNCIKDSNWYGRILVLGGSNHEGSKIPHGFLLRYQFRMLKENAFDNGIREIILAENSDDLLDLMNNSKNNPAFFETRFIKNPNIYNEQDVKYIKIDFKDIQ